VNQGPFRPLSLPLVSAAWLRAHLADPASLSGASSPGATVSGSTPPAFAGSALRLLDARWYLGARRGLDEYEKGHLPGAAFIDLDRDLAAPKGSGPGRHPLPSPRAFASVLGRFGITPTTCVIAYDDAGGAIAARVWWLLRHFGLINAAVLDGGIGAWTEAGGALVTEAPVIVPAPPMVLAPRTDVVDKLAVDRLRSSPEALVLDARATERFEGKSEPIDARPGHVPGARSAPFVENLMAAGGKFRDREALARRFENAGAPSAKTIVSYCGSGVTACHNLLALSLIGRPDALLYEGSWSDWAADDELPAATGSS
jgi:thiosulfate/3-mercaptopyruvate sulfurtransferase